jgi:regulator of protease activity HflC (stomatin/prohibitin superfamily)
MIIILHSFEKNPLHPKDNKKLNVDYTIQYSFTTTEISYLQSFFGVTKVKYRVSDLAN